MNNRSHNGTGSQDVALVSWVGRDVDACVDGEPEAAYVFLPWLFVLDTVENAEVTSYVPEGYLSRSAAECELPTLDDPAELSEALRREVLDFFRDATSEQMVELLYEMLRMMMPAQASGFVSGLRPLKSVRQARGVHAPGPTESASDWPWSAYLAFAEGTEILVEYESWIGTWPIGSATVLDLTPDLLRLHLHIDKWEQFGVPETDAVMAILYLQEGAGNRAEIVVNGSRYAEKNVTIRSENNAREILMDIDFLGHRVDRITLNGKEPDRPKLEFQAGGMDHVLVLTKSSVHPESSEVQVPDKRPSTRRRIKGHYVMRRREPKIL